MLTATQVARLRPAAQEYRLADAGGLHLAILPSGRKYWRWGYTFHGRRLQLSFGRYPVVTLERAREKRLEAWLLLQDGIDPSAARQQATRVAQAESFGVIAEEWLARERARLLARTWEVKCLRVRRYLLRRLRHLPIRTIAPADVLHLLQVIERRGHHDVAHRMRAIASQIFRYAVVTSRGDTDPAAALAGALLPIRVRHHPALLDPVAVGTLLTTIDQAQEPPVLVAALKLSPLVFLRPGELRLAEWSEIDLEAAMWRVPAHRMKPTKTRIDHVVPLSRQAVAILRELQAVANPQTPLVFPARKDPQRAISDAKLPIVLRRLGYSAARQSMHGFRTLASTHLREIGFEGDLVELQLSHKIPNAVRAAYDRAARVPERVHMMQAWADHLDDLKAGRVVAFTGRGACA